MDLEVCLIYDIDDLFKRIKTMKKKQKSLGQII